MGRGEVFVGHIIAMHTIFVPKTNAYDLKKKKKKKKKMASRRHTNHLRYTPRD
jgi:hypothetical protein